jgi:Cytochrome P460
VDDVVRSGRLLLIAVIAAPATIVVCLGGSDGCAGRDAQLVGISPPRAAERKPREGDAESSPVPADFRLQLSRTSDRFLSVGHGRGFDAVAWSNDAARTSVDGGGYAQGAMLVEELVARGAPDGGGAEGLLVMEKRADGWRFVAVSPAGDVAGDARAEACAACHRDATRDFVFQTPAPTAR